MLVLKAYLARNHELPTLIFDEIDTGVSGKVATKVGAMLEEMADHMQIVAITHLPQVASKGNSHFRVVKTVQADQTRTEIMSLSHEDRIEEIASMLGGAEASEASLRNARELLGY
jgi:DNA repair protein RecN (Recombination protein N)